MKYIKQILNFLVDMLLWLIAYLLTPVIEILTFIIVLFKYGFGAMNYFKGAGYSFDVSSAGRNRTFWNIIIVSKNGIKFHKNTIHSISWFIGINYLNKSLTWFGYFLYYFLFVIDVTKIINWDKLLNECKLELGEGHCKSIITEKEKTIYINTDSVK